MLRRSIIILLSSTILYCIWIKYGIEYTVKLLGAYSMILLAIVTGFISILWTEFIYFLYDKYVNKRNMKKLKTNNNNFKSIYLYEWLSNLSFDERYFYGIINGNSQDDFLKNLQTVRNKMVNKIGGRIEDYYLMRNALEHLKNEMNSFAKKVENFIFPIFISFITFYIIKRPEVTDKIVGVPELDFNVNIISVLCIVIAIFIIATRGAKSFFRLSTIKERNIDALLIVINSIISEKEFKNR